MSDLLFFPMSMPDEMLHSRITRYHFLSGNRTVAETFRDLFGSDPFPIGVLPKRIEVLAARLPGEMERNLDELINNNTTFPAYRPFLGVSQGAAGTYKSRIGGDVARVPRRETSINGKARICLSCVQEDLIKVGYAYWHRSHHLPGVTACWRHGDLLIHACPNCSHPFYRRLRLLPNLTEPCVCGWSPLTVDTPRKGDKQAIKFAEFAHQIMQCKLPLMHAETLCACYVRQCRKRGYTHGQLTSTAKLFESIQAKYGDEALSQMDKAYEEGRHEQWIRFNSYKGQMDMPLARHLIIALHLFGSFNEFEEALKKELILQSASNPRPRSKPDKPQPSKKTQYRQKIELLLELRSGANLEYLWERAYQATRWLKENDNLWLMAKLNSGERQLVSAEIFCDQRDSAYAAILQSGITGMYRVTKDQKRVNIANMQKLLPTRLPPSPAMRRQRFPLASQQIDINLESVWHFRLRRLVWAICEMVRLGLPLNGGSLETVSTVPRQIFPVLVSFFEWDLESFARNGVDPEDLLKSTGVSRDWEGPPGFNTPLGGWCYQRKSVAGNTKIQ